MSTLPKKANVVIIGAGIVSGIGMPTLRVQNVYLKIYRTQMNADER